MSTSRSLAFIVWIMVGPLEGFADVWGSPFLSKVYLFDITTAASLPSLIFIGMILVGICSAYQIIAIYKASTYVPEHVASLTTAMTNMIIMTFGYAFHSIIGLVIESLGGADNALAFNAGISVIPIALTLGTLGFTRLLRK